jgi:HAD superfamily hydrolase (TIGR01484 family)
MYSKVKVIAMDLDGTLTQHKQKLSAEHRARLDALSKKYKLLMVGAGQVDRIFNQMDKYPIDIIGNYGLQYGVYNPETKSMDTVRNITGTVEDKDEIERRATYIRNKYGYTEFKGANMEYHPSGCLTLPLLGTKADIADKLAFDPDRKKRRAFYPEVCELFSDYTVFVGGSSSFDMAPMPYNKRYALDVYCEENGLLPENVLFIGDDYGEGGNDESVYKSEYNFLTIDDYRDFVKLTEFLL